MLNKLSVTGFFNFETLLKVKALEVANKMLEVRYGYGLDSDQREYVFIGSDAYRYCDEEDPTIRTVDKDEVVITQYEAGNSPRRPNSIKLTIPTGEVDGIGMDAEEVFIIPLTYFDMTIEEIGADYTFQVLSLAKLAEVRGTTIDGARLLKEAAEKARRNASLIEI